MRFRLSFLPENSLFYWSLGLLLLFIVKPKELILNGSIARNKRENDFHAKYLFNLGSVREKLVDMIFFEK